MKDNWECVEAGWYIDGTRRYTIYQDQGAWVLCGRDSLVQYFSSLGGAKSGADKLVTGVSVAADAATISSGHIVHGTYGWVILHRPQHGVWKEVAGPFRSRSEARQFLWQIAVQ